MDRQLSNVPIDVAAEAGADTAIFILCACCDRTVAPLRGLLPILRRALSIAIDRKYHADVRHHTGRCRLVAIAPPDRLAIDLLDFSHTAELIEQGYASAMVALEEWPGASADGRDDPRWARVAEW